jgi:hypothetical protein
MEMMLMRTRHSAWPMAFLLSTEHFQELKFPFNIKYSEVKQCMTQHCYTNQQVNQENEMWEGHGHCHIVILFLLAQLST